TIDGIARIRDQVVFRRSADEAMNCWTAKPTPGSGKEFSERIRALKPLKQRPRKDPSPQPSPLRKGKGRIVGSRSGMDCSWRGLELLACLGIILSGCAVGPNYHAPKTELPAQWSEGANEGATNGPAQLVDWWKSFRDQELDSLMTRAVSSNFT